MSLRRLIVASLVFVAWTVHPAFAQSPSSERVVQVRCDRGASLQSYIDGYERVAGTRRVVFQIHGFCDEHVDIRYSLTLRGADQAASGITGPADLQGQIALVQVNSVNGAPAGSPRTVQIENLTIKESPMIGLLILGSEVGVDDVIIRDHAQDGMSVTSAGFVLANRLQVTDNGGHGVNSRVASRIACTDCTLTNNGGVGQAGAIAQVGGVVNLINSSISGATGVRVLGGGEVLHIGGSVTASAYAGYAMRGGQLRYQDNTQAAGDLWCEQQAGVSMGGTHGSTALTQLATGAAGRNNFHSGCMVSLFLVNATFAGHTQVAHRAHVAVVPNGTASFGTLGCSAGGTAATGGPASTFIVGGVPGVPASCNP